MRKNSKLHGSRKYVTHVIAALALMAVTAGTVASQAGNDIVGQWNHFTSCFDLMINNTPQQVRECDPKVNTAVSTNPSLSTPVPAAPLLPSSSSSSSTTTGS